MSAFINNEVDLIFISDNYRNMFNNIEEYEYLKNDPWVVDEEHFYESVYKDELVRIVKEQLTLPSFSIKREREIMKLINIIKDKIKKDKEDFDGDELESLELVIEKYVNIEELEKKIKNVSNELADYYDKKSISFSKGIPINFRDKDNLRKNVAKRIYFTRNALVHYKSNDLIQKGRRNI